MKQFLPDLAQANLVLEEKLKTHGPESLDIENTDGCEEKIVEMVGIL